MDRDAVYRALCSTHSKDKCTEYSMLCADLIKQNADNVIFNDMINLATQHIANNYPQTSDKAIASKISEVAVIRKRTIASGLIKQGESYHVALHLGECIISKTVQSAAGHAMRCAAAVVAGCPELESNVLELLDNL